MGNTPKLRFEGFTDAWEQRKLGYYFEERSERRLHEDDELLSVTIADGVIKQSDSDKKNTASSDTSNYKMVYPGDLAYNSMRMWQGAEGVSKFVGIVSPAYTVIKPKASIDTTFFAFMFKQERMLKTFERNSQGLTSDTWNLKFPALSKITVSAPLIEEQQSIVNCLNDIDSLITLHQRKCDALTKAKTFYLQNLFPQEGEKEPKLRLEGFTGAWDQYTLGDLYTERNERGNETLQILTVSIHTGVSDGALEEDELGKSVRRSEDKTLYKHVYAGDLIFNMMRAWQGAIGVAKSEGMISPAYISAIPDERIYPPFMNYLLRRKEIISQINNLSYGVTDFRKRLYWDSFIKVKCCLPSVDEQKSITDVFEQLDTLITRQEHRIKALKTMKKFMLQNMFPQEG